jgi:transposase
VAAKKYSQEFKDALVQEVVRNSESVAKVAREHGVNEQTLRNWVGEFRKKNPAAEPELTESERAKLKRLEAENRDLRQEVEFLGKATAFFAKKYPRA